MESSVKTDEDLKAFLQTLAIVEPLEPRDAFLGVWTNAATHASIEEQIKYVDLTSLYPWLN